MAVANVAVLNLADADREALEALLLDFDRSWADGRLGARLRELSSDHPLRRPALAEMVKIDLERQWQAGRRVALEQYLKDYPELGTPKTVAADLIQADYEVRKQFGVPVDLSDFARRFARPVEELRRLFEQNPEIIAAAESATGAKATKVGGPSTKITKSEPSNPTPSLPERFGRYRVVRQLGQGGMGTVYLVHDEKLDRTVALKVPHFGPGDGSQAFERFQREARAAATLDHPNLCPVYDVGEVEGVHYFTMPYVEGKPLSELIRRDKLLPQRQVAALVRKLALALHVAHDKGVVHRDLKPANIMIKRGGEPLIMDFGLARRSSENVRLTQSGAVIGTPAYMSPEQLSGHPDAVGPASDVYSLGVILYELLTGRMPFEGPMLALVGQILTQEPARPSQYRPDVDSALEAICGNAMAKQAIERYASMADLAKALTEYLRSNAQSVLQAARTSSQADLDRLAARLLPEFSELALPPAQARVQAAVPQRRRRMRSGLVAAVSAAGFVALAGIIVIITHKDGRKTEIRINGEVQRLEMRHEAEGRDQSDDNTSVRQRQMTGARRPDVVRPRLFDQPAWAKCLAFSPDGRYVAAGCWDNALRVWDVGDGKLLYNINAPWVSSVVFSRDGRYVLTGGSMATGSVEAVRLYDLSTGKDCRSFSGHTWHVQSVAFSRDGHRALSGGGGTLFKDGKAVIEDGKHVKVDCTIRLWAVDSGKELCRLEGHTDAVTGVAFLPDDRRAISGSEDGTLRIWNLETRKELGRLESQGMTGPVRGLTLSADGRRALSFHTLGNFLVLWDIPGRKELRRLPGETPWITATTISSNGNQVLTASQGGTVRLWDADIGKVVKVFDGHTTAVHAVAFSPDGRWAVSAAGKFTDFKTREPIDCAVRLWQIGQE